MSGQAAPENNNTSEYRAAPADTGNAADVQRRIANEFAAQAGAIPGVRTVATVPLGEALGIWIVLDGDLTGQVRRAVYALEAAFFRRYQEAEIDFRLIDAAEYPANRRAGLLPTGAETLFDRTNAASMAVSADAG
jgi:hypothetical protein